MFKILEMVIKQDITKLTVSVITEVKTEIAVEIPHLGFVHK